MTFRTENKIILSKHEEFSLRQKFSQEKILPIYQMRIINSIYFDTDDLKLFIDSEEGTLPRKKIRIRSYFPNKENLFLFEKKISSVEGRFKESNNIKEELSNFFLE